MFAKADYSKHRCRILPIFEASAKKNNHDFADNIDKALLSGRAFLFISNDCFFVLEPINQELVEVVFGFSFGGNSCVKYQPCVEQLAKKIGAKKLCFHTTLRGFAILAKQMGYTKQSQSGRVTTWVKEVNHG
jgi:hypothetical protein